MGARCLPCKLASSEAARVSSACSGVERYMNFDPALFLIDPTPRRADGEYMAHARISGTAASGIAFTHASGDLAGFDLRDDAIRYAHSWATEWLEKRYG
jgi:hypothetical protein